MAMTIAPGRVPGADAVMPEPPRRWIAGFDGLRALAVLAVVVFHFAPSVLPGGFLGVDLFFVISGFLITTLLLGEIDETGQLGVADFYRRRVRRLLPSVYVLVAVVAAASLTIWRDELATLRASVVSSLLYVTNWWLIGGHQSYFVATGRPPMLQHLWSLAIEEQFYLVWPPVLLLVVGLTARRGQGERHTVLTAQMLSRVALVAGAGAVLSALAMAVLAIIGDVPYGADSGRIYFGSDTHGVGLLLGAAGAALSLRARFGARLPLFRGAFVTDLLALLALIFFVRTCLRVNEFQPWLYRGGFLLIDLVAVIGVMAIARSGSAVGWVLERPPLRWIGRRSYAIYLWHWPIAVVTRPGVDVHLPAVIDFILRITLTLLLADASYHLVEVPLRHYRAGDLKAWLGALTPSQRQIAPAAGIASAAVLATLAYLVVQTPSTGGNQVNPVAQTQRGISAGASGSSARSGSASTAPAHHPTQPAATTAPKPAATHPPTPSRATPSGRASVPAARASSKPVPVAPKPAVAPTNRAVPSVSAFGDSVLLGAAPALAQSLPGVSVDAVEGRQARAVFADIDARRQAGTLGPVVIIHAGDNGIISQSDLDSLLRRLAGVHRIVLLTDRVPRDWQDPNNAVIAASAHSVGNVVLLDWYKLSAKHPEWFYADGLHLKPNGAAAYATLVSNAINS